MPLSISDVGLRLLINRWCQIGGLPQSKSNDATGYNLLMNDRVRERTARMEVRVYRSLAAHDRDDGAFWAALPVEERILQVWKLSEEQWRLRGELPDESGFPRSVARVVRP